MMGFLVLFKKLLGNYERQQLIYSYTLNEWGRINPSCVDFLLSVRGDQLEDACRKHAA